MNSKSIFFLVQLHLVAGSGTGVDGSGTGVESPPSDEFLFCSKQLQDWLKGRKQSNYYTSASSLPEGASLVVPGKCVRLLITRPIWNEVSPSDLIGS